MRESIDVPTLRSLLAQAELGLAPTGPIDDTTLERPVRWVHSSDLVDPTPFLADDLVLLTTGTHLDPGSDHDIRAYVRRLADRDLVALGFGTGVAHESVPDTLRHACHDASLPLFEVPLRTPFLAVARHSADAIAAAASAHQKWALAAQRAISLAAFRPQGLASTVTELSRQLGAWVGLFDAAGDITHEHPPSHPAEELRTEVQRVLRRGAVATSVIEVAGLPVTVHTLGRTGQLRGVLAVGLGAPDQLEHGVITGVIAMAGLALEQHEGVAKARDALRAALMRALITADTELVERTVADVWGPLPVAPIVVGLTDTDARHRDGIAGFLAPRAGALRDRVFFGAIPDGLVIVTTADDTEVFDRIVQRVGGTIGVSPPTDYARFARAVDQARTARDRGEGTVFFTDVASEGVLSALSPTAHTLAEATLEPLTRHDRRHGTALVHTTRIWLEHDCANEPAASALGVHRHTIRARLELIARLLERDLGAIAARAELWMAFHALDARQVTTTAAEA